MNIIIDAMGGDNAPLEIVKGALSAHARFGCDITLTGDEAAIRSAAARCGASTLPQGVTIHPTTETVEMCDDPATVFRRKKDSSMGVALTLLRDGAGDAVVSAGSTGALLTGATLITKRIHGIRRAAMAPVIPTTTGSAVLIDCGANAECTPEYLVQFAYLGNFYAKRVLGVETPRVGLLNIGAEDSKGTDLQKATLALLRKADEAGDLHFIGNIEAKDAIKGGCDVIVTDGFSGNVMLKSIEGVGSFAGSAVLIDCGANAECTPEYLVQFAYLGNFYAKRVLKVETPRVGLLNIGAEDSKGTDLQKATLALLRKADEAGDMHFIGNIEAKDAIKGGCDVIVTDGFSGNVMLKSIEGVGSFAGSALKGMFKKNLLTKLAALLVMPGLNEFKARLDPNKVGGTAFIGISRPVIKAHGGSNAEAIENAVGQAIQVAESGIIDDIAANIHKMQTVSE